MKKQIMKIIFLNLLILLVAFNAAVSQEVNLLDNYNGPCSSEADNIIAENLNYARQLIPHDSNNWIRDHLSAGGRAFTKGLSRMSLKGNPNAFFASWDAELEKYPFLKAALDSFVPPETRSALMLTATGRLRGMPGGNTGIAMNMGSMGMFPSLRGEPSLLRGAGKAKKRKRASNQR